MQEYKITNVAPGVDILKAERSDFKTNSISVSLAVPLSASTASLNALVSMLLSRRSKQYDSIEKLNRRLAFLYGAVLCQSSVKVGESQVLKLEITALDNRFSLDRENISNACAELLLSLLFAPCLDSGVFYETDIVREKRLLVEKIESRENEKRLYALDRAVEIMFAGEPYAVSPLGSRSEIEKITPASAYAAYHRLLSGAKVLLTVVGGIDTAKTADRLREKFAGVQRSYLPPAGAVFRFDAQHVKYEEERINIKQGKLILGFRVHLKSAGEMAAPMLMFTDIFGGGPYSKLFANVREKMSLCYYCAAAYDRRKRFLSVQCGCEEENTDTAVAEILRQLEIIKSGDFDSEFEASKVSLINFYASVSDTPEGLAAWYAQQITDDNIKTPAEMRQKIESVTKAQIVECAHLVCLDTVFRLLPAGEGEK